MYQQCKRAMDAAAAAGALLLLSPVMAAAALAVWAQRDGPVLFRQQRPGRGEKLFWCVKLRTMRAPEYPGQPDMERITRAGKVLRRFSLDELPQLWNVLKGEMSVIGPRPLLPEYLPYYTPEQAARHDVRPGITGLAQVNGRNAAGWDERLAMDVRYVHEMSLRMDAKIFFQTLRKILSGEGLNRSETLTAQRLDDLRRQEGVRKD